MIHSAIQSKQGIFFLIDTSVNSSTDSQFFPSNLFFCYLGNNIKRWLEILYFFNPTALLILENLYQHTVSSTHSCPSSYGEWGV